MITIITPTYNRKYILENAYNSLKSQTSFEFEWIIVDDGSTDNTSELVKDWIQNCNYFHISYYKRKNGGKHRAINFGVSKSNAEYVLILDSDDYLVPNAIELIHSWLESIQEDNSIVGVAGLRGWKKNNTSIGNIVENDNFIDATNIERKKYNLLGDKAEVYSTNILKKYPFPEYDGENFIRESSVWDRIALDGYKLRWYNKIIYMCEYLEDGLTRNVDNYIYAKNYKGFLYCTKLYLRTENFIYRYHKIGHFYIVSQLINKKNTEICDLLEINIFQLYIGISIYKIVSILKNNYKRK